MTCAAASRSATARTSKSRARATTASSAAAAGATSSIRTCASSSVGSTPRRAEGGLRRESVRAARLYAGALHRGGHAMKLPIAVALLAVASFANAGPVPKPTMQQVLEASKSSDWRTLAAEDTLYLDLPAGRVVIELAPAFAPGLVANIKTLVRAGYFDGLAILRVQDNYVTQWGDPQSGEAGKARPLGKAVRTVAPEFERDAKGLGFTGLPDRDAYAPE